MTARALLAASVMLLLLSLLTSCKDSGDKLKRAPAAPPAASFTGPTYLRETIGSMVSIRDFEPLLVSNFGLVVLPPGSNTGSSQVPPYLRQKLINDMRKRGLGSARLGAMDMTPARVLADLDTAVVVVYGFIPPGAVAGTPFDVAVTALDGDTDTTSLAGGRLWTTDLAVGGANTGNLYLHPLAEANGPTYINPFDDRPDEQRKLDFRRRALIVAGGKVTKSRTITLVLNQASWSRSRLIADRINARFSKTTDDQAIAQAETDLIVNLNVPRRFAANPTQLMNLVTHLYIQSGTGFETQQANRLAELIRNDPDNRAKVNDVLLCWKAMGRAIIPVLREHYNSPIASLRLASLQGGAWLNDQQAADPLCELAATGDSATRIAAVEALVDLPRNLSVAAALNKLLDDDDLQVRLAAYETLSANNDETIGRTVISDDNGIKYLIDRVLHSEKPLIYITPHGVPRVVIFQPELGFRAPMLESMWKDKLMLRVDGEGDAPGPLQVYYREAPGDEPRQLKAQPLVATLAYLMGHQPSMDQPQEGLDLTFGQVADTIYQLCRDGAIPAPIEVRTSPLARLVEEIPQQAPDVRPETAAASDQSEAPTAPANP